MMNCRSTVRLLGLITLLCVLAPCPAQEAAPESEPFPDIAKIIADQKQANPVVLLLRAHVFEQEGRIDGAVKTYRDVVRQWAPPSRWGNLACMRVTSCFLRSKPAEPASAAEFMGKVQDVVTDPAHRRELALWAILIDLHELAESRRKDASTPLEVDLDRNIAGWHVPARLLEDFSQALERLSEGFVSAGKEKAGSVFLREVAGGLANPWLQQVALRKLVSLQLQAGQGADALVSARAYWVLSVLRPSCLVDAISQVIECMRTLGATKEQIEQYRLLQIYGQTRDAEGSHTDVTDPLPGLLSKHASGRTLISTETIEGQKSDARKARLYLLNGDLVHAAPLLKRLEGARGGTERRAETIHLIRMALAVKDGHVHATDRYEHFIYQRPGASAGSASPEEKLRNPLDELIEEAGSDEPKTAG